MCKYNKHTLEKKILIDEDICVEWSYVSDITFVQEFVELINVNSGERQLIYKGGGICTVEFVNGELRIFVDRGSYSRFEPDNNFNVHVVLDTTCKGSYLYKNN